MAFDVLKVMSSKSHILISNTHNQTKLKYVFKCTSKESRVNRCAKIRKMNSFILILGAVLGRIVAL